MICYLDDMLLLSQSTHELLQAGKTTWDLLEALGFVINTEKSTPVPNQVMEFLGMTINSRAMTLRLSQEKIQKILMKCGQTLQQEEVSVRELSKLIGTFSSTTQAILPARLHYRQLQMLLTTALMKVNSYESIIKLTAECKEEIRWWMTHLEEVNGRAVTVSPPDITIETDASLIGWGAAWQKQMLQGHWTEEERTEPINALELRAVYLAIKAFFQNRRDLHILVKADNITAVAHINKMGGTRSPRLVGIAKQLWEYCLQRNLMLTAEYLPGSKNVQANRLSRDFPDSSDWRLDPVVFKSLNSRWPCKVDLFASRWNRQLPQFISWKTDPDAMAVDAFSIQWVGMKTFMFPPFSMINRCLAKILQEKADAVLITPTWHTQPWYGTLLSVLVDHPILLPQSIDLLRSPTGAAHPLLENKSMHLAAWKVSGNSRLHKAFQETLPTCSPVHGGKARGQLTTAPGVNGIAGAQRGRLIRFMPLWK